MKRLFIIFSLAFACLFPSVAWASTVNVPIFPEDTKHYLLLKNNYFDEYYLILADWPLRVDNSSGYENGSPAAVIELNWSPAVAGIDPYFASYTYNPSVSEDWIFTKANPHSNEIKIFSFYQDEVNEILKSEGSPLPQVHGNGNCGVGMNLFSSVVFCDEDITFVLDWGSDDSWGYDKLIPWIPDSDVWWEKAIFYFEGTWRNLWVKFTTNIVPISISIFAIVCIAYWLAKFLRTNPFFGYLIKKPSGKKNKRLKPSKVRSYSTHTRRRF